MIYNVPVKKEKEIDIPFNKLKDSLARVLKVFDGIENPRISHILTEFRINGKFHINHLIDDNIIYSDSLLDKIEYDFEKYLKNA